MSIGHGSIPLEFGYGPFKTKVTVYGGPITQAPHGMIAVNLREEEPDHGNFKFLIKDFGVPKQITSAEFLETILPVAIREGSLYVGCAGGTGRTGLVLALLARVAGEQHPVRYVRANYKKHAVETSEQERFVEKFPSNWVAVVQAESNRAGFKRFFTRFF